MRLNRTAVRQSIAFLGSFLLFSIEILTTKLLLPSFGGAAYVWTTSCMFFQAVLLAGYLYSEGALSWLGAGRYVPLHLGLLLLPPFFFPLTLRLPAELSHPIGALMACLIWAIGVPFFVLSTTSPVIQSWGVASGEAERESYRIFAASNSGALLALLAYPFLIEPYSELRFQLRAWYGLYVLYAALHLLCLPVRTHHHSSAEAPPAEPAGQAVGGGLVWFLLSLGPSASMLACTNLLTLDFAAVPLLWIAPLAIYLATFILNFKKNPWYPKRLSMMFVAAMIVWFAFVLLTVMFSLDVGQQWIAFRRLWAVNKFVFMCASLFIVCMICHKALSQSKPSGKQSARFYAWIGAGGWAGSALIGVLLPWLGSRTARPEIDWAIAGGISLLALIVRDSKQIKELALSGRSLNAPEGIGGPSGKLKVSIAALCAAIVIMGAGFGFYVNRSLTFSNGLICSMRNFYGYYAVVDDPKGFRKFYHGNTLHGMQYLDPAKQDIPLIYYHRGSPIGELLRLNKDAVKDVAVAGLGVGVLAADGYAGQRFDFYELDSDVAAIARKYFVFLKDSPSKVRIFTGDARLVLSRQERARYDLIVLDAFTGGAIPVHLLTQEAFELYLSRLNPNGMLAVHVTNRFLNLRPVVAALARAEGLSLVGKISHPRATPNDEEYYSSWIALAKDPARLSALRDAGWEDLSCLAAQSKPWTDQYASLWSALGN